MTTLYFILYLLSAVCFIAAAFAHYGITTATDGQARLTGVARVNLVALGLLFWVLVPLIVTARAL